jgi:hypothetical protein
VNDEEALEIADARYDLLPERKLLIGLVPVAGGAIAGYLGDRRDRIARRAAEFQTIMLQQSRLTPEEILEKIAGDERLEELFWFVLDAATRTSLETKRKALGRLLGERLLDDASVDETELFLRTLAGLESVDLRLLSLIESFGAIRQGVQVKHCLESKVEGGVPRAVAQPLFSNLTSRGLIESDRVIDGGTAEGSSDDWDSDGYLITSFGRDLLRWIREAEV